LILDGHILTLKADDVNNYLCYLWPLKIKKWPSKQTKKIDARIVAKQGPKATGLWWWTLLIDWR
jgi:hypothetical protein